MTDMIERAARAISAEHGVDPDWVNADPQRHVIPREDGVSGIVTDHIGPIWTMWTGDARAALLAALDPEDDQLVADVLRDLEDEDWDEFGKIVRIVIASLRKKTSQGV